MKKTHKYGFVEASSHNDNIFTWKQHNEENTPCLNVYTLAGSISVCECGGSGAWCAYVGGGESC